MKFFRSSIKHQRKQYLSAQRHLCVDETKAMEANTGGLGKISGAERRKTKFEFCHGRLWRMSLIEVSSSLTITDIIFKKKHGDTEVTQKRFLIYFEAFLKSFAENQGKNGSPPFIRHEMQRAEITLFGGVKLPKKLNSEEKKRYFFNSIKERIGFC